MPKDAYRERLEQLLGVPPPDDEAKAVLRVVRGLFLPAFHPECSISLVQSADGYTLIVRTLLRSAWYYFNSIQSGWHPDPQTSWLEPASSVERIALPESAHESFEAQLGLLRAYLSAEDAGGIDGMPCVGETWFSWGSGRTIERWSPSTSGDEYEQFFVNLVEIGLHHAEWERSQRALKQIRQYFTR